MVLDWDRTDATWVFSFPTLAESLNVALLGASTLMSVQHEFQCFILGRNLKDKSLHSQKVA